MAAHGSQMRVIFPKLPEFGQGKKTALSEYLANKTHSPLSRLLQKGCRML